MLSSARKVVRDFHGDFDCAAASYFAGIALYFILRWINRADRAERSAQRDVEKDAQQWYEKVKGSQGTVNPFGTDKTGNKTGRQ